MDVLTVAIEVLWQLLWPFVVVYIYVWIIVEGMIFIAEREEKKEKK